MGYTFSALVLATITDGPLRPVLFLFRLSLSVSPKLYRIDVIFFVYTADKLTLYVALFLYIVIPPARSGP